MELARTSFRFLVFFVLASLASSAVLSDGLGRGVTPGRPGNQGSAAPQPGTSSNRRGNPGDPRIPPNEGAPLVVPADTATPGNQNQGNQGQTLQEIGNPGGQSGPRSLERSGNPGAPAEMGTRDAIGSSGSPGNRGAVGASNIAGLVELRAAGGNTFPLGLARPKSAGKPIRRVPERLVRALARSVSSQRGELFERRGFGDIRYQNVICESPAFCFYCSMAKFKGGFFSGGDGSESQAINEVGRKCLLSLSDSYVGDLLSRPEYALLMTINPDNERNAFFSSLVKQATEKKESLAELACQNEEAKGVRDASYCVACTKGSDECLREVERLCEEGYVYKNGYQQRGSFNYHANFFWKRLHEDAPTICHALRLLSTSEQDNILLEKTAKAVIADVITEQCEYERIHIPCYKVLDGANDKADP